MSSSRRSNLASPSLAAHRIFWPNHLRLFTAIVEPLERAWRQMPALFYGLHILIGAALPLTCRIELLLPLVALWLLLFFYCCHRSTRIRLLFAILLLGASMLLTQQRIRWCPLPEQGILGVAQLQIDRVQQRHSSFGSSMIYAATLRSFAADRPAGHEPLPLRNLPCSFALPLQAPLLDGTVLLHGRLQPGRYPQLQFKPLGDVAGNSSGLAQWRRRAKESVRSWIQLHVEDHSAAVFLSGMATGDLDDPILLTDLGRFGLQHLLAISGLHFALLASLLALLLRSCLGDRAMAPLLVLLLSAYALFVGDSPSVLRAWLGACSLWCGLLLQRPTHAANSLGIALGALVLYKPIWVLHLGFQLSFLATAAILLLSQPVDRLLQRLLPARPLPELTAMTRLDQHGYLFLYSARKAAAITLAVHLAVCPLIAMSLHQLNPLSLLYNLFFPPLMAPALWLLALAGLLALPIPWLSDLICQLNSHYTGTVLSLVECAPTRLDAQWHCALPPLLCLIWLIGLFVWALPRPSNQPQPHWLI